MGFADQLTSESAAGTITDLDPRIVDMYLPGERPRRRDGRRRRVPPNLERTDSALPARSDDGQFDASRQRLTLVFWLIFGLFPTDTDPCP